MLIRNFGHFWERKYINNGGGRKPGHLRGYVSAKRQADFREQIGIYVLYDKDLLPMYVGQAGMGNASMCNLCPRTFLLPMSPTVHIEQALDVLLVVLKFLDILRPFGIMPFLNIQR